MLPEYARHRADANEAELYEAARFCGFVVHRIGRPVDWLLVGHGHVVLAEIKSPLGKRGGRSKSGQHLSEAQQEFADSCAVNGVQVYVWRSKADVMRDLVRIRKMRPLYALPPIRPGCSNTQGR